MEQFHSFANASSFDKGISVLPLCQFEIVRFDTPREAAKASLPICRLMRSDSMMGKTIKTPLFLLKMSRYAYIIARFVQMSSSFQKIFSQIEQFFS